MSLDLSKLENVRKAAHGKTIARCPACADAGGDEKGNHLVIYEDGKYGCVAYPNDKAHSKEIFALVGTGGGATPPVRLSVQTFQAPASTVMMDLGRFDRFNVQRTQPAPVIDPAPSAVDPPKRVVAVPAKLQVEHWEDATEEAVLETA